MLNGDKPDEENITIRQNKYLNNLIEQDCRNIKRRAQTLLAGIELLQMIRKEQYQHPLGDGLPAVEQFYLLAA